MDIDRSDPDSEQDDEDLFHMENKYLQKQLINEIHCFAWRFFFQLKYILTRRHSGSHTFPWPKVLQMAQMLPILTRRIDVTRRTGTTGKTM